MTSSRLKGRARAAGPATTGMLLPPGTPDAAEMRARFREVAGAAPRRGGYGVVRPALDVSTGRRAAIKEIPKVRPGATTMERLARYQLAVRREVANLRHVQGCDRVSELLAVYEDDDVVYVVQAWYEPWRPGPDVARREARELLEAVAHCHERGVAHCDLKPANIMASGEGLRLVDFGGSQRCCGHAYGLTQRVGTPAYIAAEMWHGVSYGLGVDVWAAGVVVFEALTGRHPFHVPGMSHAQVAESICTGEHAWSGPDLELVPRDARDLVDLLLARDPSCRPTAREALQHPFVR